MTAPHDTRQLYDRSAADWRRNQPMLLSDYTARPFVMNLCAPVQGRSFLDLGCGEGYVSRQLADLQAGAVHGVDLSAEMIRQAHEQSTSVSGDTRLTYEAGDLRVWCPELKQKYDVVLAVFLFNYLTSQEMTQVLQLAFDSLRPEGTLIFTVPHPLLPWLRPHEFPFYFDADAGYFSGLNRQFQGQIWRRDRQAVHVQCVHKRFSDYFEALRTAGFSGLPEVHELTVTDEHLRIDPEFFTPLLDTPLHAAFRIQR